MRPLFVSATGTNVGKTYTTLRLIKAFARKNIRVGVCKPIETGVTDTPVDAKLLLDACRKANPAFRSFSPFDITAYTFPLPAAPFSADTRKTIQVDKIHDKIRELHKHCDLLIIEGAGGLMVPITSDYLMIDLARELGAKILLVTPSRLGCINDTLLSIEALRNRDIDFDWCVNLYEDSDTFEKVTKPFYDIKFPHWWDADKGVDHFVKNYL
ncbi:MAG: dethiobiotin synthase [Campylobacterota bacterium]|nr:dethiobiotin synthase [Campylobacterota bacterium]